MTNYIYADELIGRPVTDRTGRAAGRIAELRCEKHDNSWAVSEFVLGIGGVLERLNVAFAVLLGRDVPTRVAHVTQVDLSNPRRPRLTCDREELRDTGATPRRGGADTNEKLQ